MYIITYYICYFGSFGTDRYCMCFIASLSVISVPLFRLGQIAIVCASLSIISVPLIGLGQNAISCTLFHVISVPLIDVYFIACNSVSWHVHL